MRKHSLKIGVVIALAAVSALVLSTAGSAGRNASFKMAIVTDIGSIQDRSFNQLANEGRIAVGNELRVPTRVYQTTSEAERIPNMLAACRAGYVIGATARSRPFLLALLPRSRLRSRRAGAALFRRA